MTSLVQRFNVRFQVIPTREWSQEVFSGPLDLLGLVRIPGEIEVDLKILKGLMGTFKTAHPGRIISQLGPIPTCFAQKICVKQAYRHKSTGEISRYRDTEAHAKVVKEVVCLDWATILLDLTYRFIEEAVAEHGEPLGGIPQLRFVRAMLAEDPVAQKHFLIEEWIGGDMEFVKYINNGHPVSCVRGDASEEVHQIAEFLCFAQHVQFNKTGGLAYTSDYQGL